MIRRPRAAITGWPVAHSRSPLVHGHWLKKYGLAGDYIRLPVAPEDAERFYRHFGESGLVGCNVTVPHKETAAAACDELDEAARAMGAVNTLWLDGDGRLCGANTDGIGFLGNLDQRAPGWDARPGPAVVLGAGGAARAVVWALRARGFAPVKIFNRTTEKASQLADHFGFGVEAYPWDKLCEHLGQAALLVNTTAAGMTGKPPLQIDLDGLPKDALVTDIIYTPLETDLLRQAAARGNRTVDGLGMLLHQAAPGFERWFGVRPEVDDELRRIVLADLGATT
ncbi:shikimate dehydrogenase [Polymorphum gilvum]|uniref:Shikimate dehydrogenase (NADP(+)) n=1 Tax=Polymorphum gilvum (strain LMG 25793 / CGMCC 1.9160 / SL003B-26A1) TaxID=991905 RepID=F2IYJ5_POLGS|nr:shikimate dehydrogenase [Polymorphum gilvum]ADZ68508.1 Shikimate 5-dehydrogenase [Polymorphum gilvum SL003B-26A1]